MSDDIVTRLRSQRTNAVICEQAADAIEQLRSLNSSLAECLSRTESRVRLLRTELDNWRNTAGIMHQAFLDQDEETLLTAYFEACRPESEPTP